MLGSEMERLDESWPIEAYIILYNVTQPMGDVHDNRTVKALMVDPFNVGWVGGTTVKTINVCVFSTYQLAYTITNFYEELLSL